MGHQAGKWKDLILGGLGLGLGQVVVPTLETLIGNIKARQFDTGDYVYGDFEFQHDYKEGSDFAIHVHWCPTNDDTGNIAWELEYTQAASGIVMPAVTTIEKVEAAPGAALHHKISVFPTIDGANTKIDSHLPFRLIRRASGDTFTGGAMLLAIGLHYQTDSIGSNQPASKN